MVGIRDHISSASFPFGPSQGYNYTEIYYF